MTKSLPTISEGFQVRQSFIIFLPSSFFLFPSFPLIPFKKGIEDEIQREARLAAFFGVREEKTRKQFDDLLHKREETLKAVIPPSVSTTVIPSPSPSRVPLKVLHFFSVLLK